ncbi:PEP-CTERM-box response regulator transcription factor [methanotrophic endosymbiont of Bathymodiolus puteoserpentis (Logatchev)]|jgi:two-component system NtrC family response regulator|uniref:PEP-CTERM-box response regulator transcription factor n=1 Tax=methanotrophic endosymbiont of Bathymodiolus puteoserpentis (Logatchev) TaxID=343235 RepID=UPI0013C69424|nr:PEP-CTERM-box response regulator transcription factor [methanotrophic endosymbiont of Bathymodiolus puteoserpentis (Logatchev)]SHE22012.1 Response regulatory protein [methanotrophic endosymbiont of Bathymodiolus puteoserpentis (Logatchev)]
MDDKKVLLVVEDDLGLQKQFKWSFPAYQVVIAGDRESAIDALRRYTPSVVTLDLGLPPDPANASEGLATLKEILELAPKTKVIVVTGNDDRENAIKAVAMGAYDFYQKPADIDVLNLIVSRAFQLNSLEQENIKLQQQTSEPLSGIIAVSEKMQKLSRMIEKIAPSSITTLLLGESGTGKEVLAHAIHELSPRAGKPFVAVNCAAIPETLLESELFGYEKGAFTGAAKQTIGKIEYAQGGTFFLDEIGDLPFSLQAKLLRFIQERVIERLGGRGEIPVDVRIICATHKNIQDLIDAGSFREDLYYRVSEMVVNIPALRERDGDAIVIAKAFLNRYSEQEKRDIKGFTAEAKHAIEAYSWPGNIRQLENKIKRAVVMTDDVYISLEDLAMQTPTDLGLSSLPLNLKQVREHAETVAIKRALAHADNNISNAAKLLGITRPTLYTLFSKYGIEGH